MTLRKLLPRHVRPVSPNELAELAQHLTRDRPVGALEEVQAQNRELLRLLDELRRDGRNWNGSIASLKIRIEAWSPFTLSLMSGPTTFVERTN